MRESKPSFISLTRSFDGFVPGERRGQGMLCLSSHVSGVKRAIFFPFFLSRTNERVAEPRGKMGEVGKEGGRRARVARAKNRAGVENG